VNRWGDGKAQDCQASGFGDRHVCDVGKADVLAGIEPEWGQENETMVRVRNRTALVLAWSM
jgi:hypothetical protein